MIIRRYTPRDRERALAIFRLNVPDFFDPREAADLETYLDRYHGTYLVVEEKREIIGAGGYHFPDASTGRLSWIFFDPRFRGKGRGGRLVGRCLAEIRKNKDVTRIVVETSQLAFRFFQTFGLAVEKRQEDYWGKGLDLVVMSMPADTNRGGNKPA